MDVDSLVQQATDLARRGQLDEARTLLRKAAGMAPLRSDIREMLLDINDYAGSMPRSRKAAPPPPSPVFTQHPPEEPPRELEMPATIRHHESPQPRTHKPSASPFARMGGGQSNQPPPPPRSMGRPGEFYAPPRGASSSWIFLWIGMFILLIAIAAGAVVVFQMLPLPGNAGKTAPKDPLEPRRTELKAQIDALEQAGKYDEAMQILDQQLIAETKLPKADSDAIRFKLYMAEGKDNRDKKKYAEAAACYSQAAQVNPQNSEALRMTGYMYFLVWRGNPKASKKDSNITQAEEYLKKAIAVDPKDFEACKQLSDVYVKTGRQEKGVEYLRQIKNLAPPNSDDAVGAEGLLKQMGMK